MSRPSKARRTRIARINHKNRERTKKRLLIVALILSIISTPLVVLAASESTEQTISKIYASNIIHTPELLNGKMVNVLNNIQLANAEVEYFATNYFATKYEYEYENEYPYEYSYEYTYEGYEIEPTIEPQVEEIVVETAPTEPVPAPVEVPQYETEESPITEEKLPAEEPMIEEVAPIEEPEPYTPQPITYEGLTIKGAADWFTTAQHIFPREADATVIDVETGRSFRIRRTFGTNHADVETLTIEDTNIMKDIWGGWSWDRRAVVVITDTGYVLAASMNGMPHAGVDGPAALSHVTNRSGGFGSGMNFDAIPGNGMHGHVCIHFFNSRNHGQSTPQAGHQNMVQVAAQYIADNF